MFSVIRAFSIRRAPLPNIQRLNRCLSISYVAAAQSRNDHSDYEHSQHAHAHEHPRHIDQASDRPLTIRIRPFPIGSIRRVFKPEGSKGDHGHVESRAPRHTPPHVRSQLSDMLTHCQYNHQVLEVIHTRVRSRQDGLDLLSNFAALIEALQKSQRPVTILRAINIIFARLHYVGVEPNKASLAYGIRCAVRAGSFEALQLYLSQTISNGHKLAVDEVRSLLQKLTGYVIKYHIKNNRSWDGRRRMQQLLRIVTGWQCDGVRRPGEERQFSINRLMRELQGSIEPFWEYYTCILRIAGGKYVLFGEWLDYNRPLLHLTSSGNDNNKTPHDLYRINERNRIAGLFARNLVLANDAERAWQVFQDIGSDVGAVDDTTWSLLLDHPQHIKIWQPAMAEKVIKKYEESVVGIEAAMGITWSGGEDGYHVTSNQEEVPRGRWSLRNPRNHWAD